VLIVREIRIREAVAGDLSALQELLTELLRHESAYDEQLRIDRRAERYFRVSIRRGLKAKRTKYLVAEHNGRIVGFVHGEIRKRKPYYAARVYGMLHNIFVVREHRRAGIGRALTAALLRWFRLKKVKHIILNVYAGNKRAAKVWRALGFRERMIIFERIIYPVSRVKKQKL
jgi:GNAT superfamily N-acetyltransferase